MLTCQQSNFSHRVRGLTESSSFQGRVQGLKAMNMLTDPQTNRESKCWRSRKSKLHFVSEVFGQQFNKFLQESYMKASLRMKHTQQGDSEYIVLFLLQIYRQQFFFQVIEQQFNNINILCGRTEDWGNLLSCATQWVSREVFLSESCFPQSTEVVTAMESSETERNNSHNLLRTLLTTYSNYLEVNWVNWVITINSVTGTTTLDNGYYEAVFF